MSHKNKHYVSGFVGQLLAVGGGGVEGGSAQMARHALPRAAVRLLEVDEAALLQLVHLRAPEQAGVGLARWGPPELH